MEHHAFACSNLADVRRTLATVARAAGSHRTWIRGHTPSRGQAGAAASRGAPAAAVQ